MPINYYFITIFFEDVPPKRSIVAYMQNSFEKDKIGKEVNRRNIVMKLS